MTGRTPDLITDLILPQWKSPMQGIKNAASNHASGYSTKGGIIYVKRAKIPTTQIIPLYLSESNRSLIWQGNSEPTLRCGSGIPN